MRPRSTLLFLLLVAAPLVLIAWLGIILTRQSDQQTQEAWLAVIEEKLTIASGTLEQEMRRLEDQFDALLSKTGVDAEALHSLPANQPLIRHAFLLDARHQVEFPTSNAQTGNQDAAFLRRTEPLWDSGVKLGSTTSAAAQFENETVGQGASFLKKTEVRPSVNWTTEKSKGATSVKISGWHLWFHGNGPELLFWQQRDDGRILGVEVEMVALMSLLFNAFADLESSTPGALRIVSGDSKSILHQVGKDVEGALPDPVASRTCPTPLGMWRLEYHPASDEQPRANALPVLLGTSGAGLALLALAWLFHRESTREMQDARQRVSFVNQVSHELKTPLTNIRLYTEMAQQQAEANGDQNTARHLAVVEAETSRLGRLIHNVLTFSRQQRDQLNVHPRLASLDGVVERVIELWQPALEAKEIIVDYRPDASQPFLFDPDAVEQILGNILSNVEKYASEGKHLGMSTSIKGSNAEVLVSDRGPGIPTHQKEIVFQPFVRLRTDVTEGVSGTGIGLSIARELAQLQGGTLTVIPGIKGAVFRLSLPFKQS